MPRPAPAVALEVTLTRHGDRFKVFTALIDNDPRVVPGNVIELVDEPGEFEIMEIKKNIIRHRVKRLVPQKETVK